MDSVLVSARVAAVLTAFVSLLLGATATAANFLDARYDEDEDNLVVTLAYRGTNPDHAFSLEWGACKQDGAPGSYEIAARVLDNQWNDLARRSYTKTVRFDLRKLRCRPAIVTLFTAPQFRITVPVPARAGTDRSLRGPRTDTVEARDFRSSISGGDLLRRCRHAINIPHGVQRGLLIKMAGIRERANRCTRGTAREDLPRGSSSTQSPERQLHAACRLRLATHTLD